MKVFLKWLKNRWQPIVFAILVIGIGVVMRTCQELNSIRINSKKIKLVEKKVEISAQQDSAIVKELQVLTDNEVLIIHTYNNNEIEINRIPEDSLQYWADSLYNR